jgi:hypothetical protein
MNFEYTGGLDLAVAYLEKYAAELELAQEKLADELADCEPVDDDDDDDYKILQNKFYAGASNLYRIEAAILAARKAHVFLSEFYADPDADLRELIDC